MDKDLNPDIPDNNNKNNSLNNEFEILNSNNEFEIVINKELREGKNENKDDMNIISENKNNEAKNKKEIEENKNELNAEIININEENNKNSNEELSNNNNIILEENVNNNLSNEEMCLRNINNDNNNNNEILINKDINDNIYIQEEKNKINVIDINEIKEEKNENKEIKIEEGFDSKVLNKLAEYNMTNYKELYFKNSFCDYFTGKDWHSGYITNISEDTVELFDSTGNGNSSSITMKIKIQDSKKIAYFRKHSLPDENMVKGASKNIINKLFQFINFHKNFKEYLDNCDSFEFYYFLRATVYYGLDFCMNPNLDNKLIETSFQLILIILNIICDCLKFIKDNYEDFLKYLNDIKPTQFKDLVLINKKYAVYSFFDDIHFLIKKIFGECPEYLDWYIKYRSDMIYFIPSINNNTYINQNIKLYSELFPLYEDQNMGDNNIKLLKKICASEAYSSNHNYFTLDKKINSFIIAYFIDYFHFLDGYNILFNILCSFKYTQENFYNFTSFSIQFNIIEMLMTAKALTNNYDFYNNKENNKELNGLEKIIAYMDEFYERINVYDDNNILNNELLNKLQNNLITLIKKNEDEEKILLDRFFIKQVFKQLKETKKLERSIALISNLNNIIKSVEYNSLYKEIKEKNNSNYNECMLTDSKFKGKDSNIKKMTAEYFCELCQENNILEFYLENKTIHEEIIKRIYPLLSIMYSNNFGYNEKSKKKMDGKYMFENLFIKLKESEKNNESMWKIILCDIILKFPEQIKKEDKIYIFNLINQYYETTDAKKSSKIVQLISFIINYSLKCIIPDDKNIPDLSNVEIIKEKENSVNNFELYEKGKFNNEKYFCLELLINYLTEKDKINELQIDNELKKNVINKCIEGIISIINKDKNNENIKQILFIKVVEGIISSINTIDNISLLRRILSLISKDETKNSIKIFFKSKKIMFNLLKELNSYLETVIKEDKNNKNEINERLNLIFFLLDNKILLSFEDYETLFNVKKYADFIQKIIYDKISENISKIGKEFQKHIIDKILLKNDCLSEVNDLMRYRLLKQFIIQINKSSGIFQFILDEKKLEEKYLIANLKKSCDEIYGYKALLNILLFTENKEIKNDISSFLTYIYLGSKLEYQPNKLYIKLWKEIFVQIKDLFSKYSNIKENGNTTKIKGLITLIKKIIEESNSDGEIINDKYIIEKILKPIKSKSSDIKQDKKPLNPIKINLEYPTGEKDDIKVIKDLCEIYPSEFFYHLRYYISYTFQIPVRCIQIKKIEQGQNIQNFNLFNDFENIYEYIDKKKKKNETPIFSIKNIKNPFNDDSPENLKNLILKDKNLSDILKNLLKEKNIDFANDIFGLIKDKIERNDNLSEDKVKIINNIIMNYNKENSELLNDLFNFNESNLFYMNYTLLNINNFLIKNNKDGTIINKFIQSSLWIKKIKDLEIELNDDINDKKYTSLNELHEIKNYEINLLNIYKTVLINKSLKNEDLDIIANNIIKIMYNIINDCTFIKLNESKNNKEEDKKELNKIKQLYLNFFKDIKDLFNKEKNLYKQFIEIFLKEDDIKKKFEYLFLDGIIKNKYPLFSELISDLFLSLIQDYDEKIKNLQQKFYSNISGIFFTKENKEKIVKILYYLYNNSNMEIMANMNKYEYNLNIYFNTISEVFHKFYLLISDEFDFEHYIQEIVIPSLFKPFLNKINKDSNFHDYFFGGQCKILYHYVNNIDANKLKNIEYYQGINIKEYLYDEIIMNNHDNSGSEDSSKKMIPSSYFKSVYSFNSVSHLFIAFLIKQAIYLNGTKQDKNHISPKKDFIYYITELGTLNTTVRAFSKGNQASDWKLYFKEKTTSNIFIGLKNLGCTCYMNSLLQVFYNITLFRESLLKCKTKTTNNNSLYEVQKVFFNLKYLKNGYYTPDTFVNNYDDEKLNPRQQMDVDEFFSNLLDKLENRIKNTDNENLIKYFFQGKLNDSLTFQEGCNHNRTKISNFYSIQLQVMNKKNIYESLDTLTEGELMNGDNCIFCPECNKKFPALKSQSFNKLPRILMFVLKRFEFNYDTMAKIKINDYYEFPKELDMSKYIQNNENNKYKLKSVVVHMGHSEGGHYYAFIKDEKSRKWYQFNDTSVIPFNEFNLDNETFGGKEDNGENKNRSAYLLFYEKVDQTDCENFDKIKILNKLIQLENDKNNEKNKIKEEDEGFNLLEENMENKISEIEEKKEEDIIDEDLIDMGGNESEGKNMIKFINEQMKEDYIKQLIFSSNYQLLNLELCLNMINTVDNKGDNFPIFIQNLCFIKNDHPILGEDYLFRSFRPLISNIKKYIDKGKIKLLKIENIKYTNEEIIKKITEIFKYILTIFFNIIIRSREKKYFGCYVEFIKYLINQYDFCADYFLEEFGCYNTLVEYLINCPMYDIKKIVAGLIYYAMIKSEQCYTKEKRKKFNETKIELTDDEIAKKLQYEENGKGEKVGDYELLKKDFSTPNVLRVVYNVAHILRKIKFWKNKNEARFLFDVLLKFSLISSENRQFLINEVNILLALNASIAQECKQKSYTENEALDFDKGVLITPHEILNSMPGQVNLGDKDKLGNYVTLEYDFMLLCNLHFFKAKTKEEIKKRHEDIGFTFWNDKYFYTLIRYCKTKQAIKYFSKLIIYKCQEKGIFDIIIKSLINYLELIKDTENSFYDESDPESKADIYKNTGENNKECSLKTLKNNISYIIKKLVMDAKNDKFGVYKIKTCISKIYSYFSKNKKYYSKAITAINIILNIFESINIDNKKYIKELNDISNWLKKFKFPPKYYEVKGINMYSDLPLIYHKKEMNNNQKADFERQETKKTNLKIDRINNILSNKKIDYNIANYDGDLSDFKFSFGDVVLLGNKEYIITECLDEMIKGKLVENNSNELDDISREKKLAKKKKDIYEKEKISFWIETDNYQLRIKTLKEVLPN